MKIKRSRGGTKEREVNVGQHHLVLSGPGMI
jgi:hypothetical protein